MIKLTIIVVSYNTRQRLYDCLSSVERSLAPEDFEYELFVVDNASSDGSADMVEEQFPESKLILNSENKGFAAANNQALNAAQGEYVLLLNPDTEVQGRALTEMASFLDEHSAVGVVGAKLVSPDGTFQHGAFRFPTLRMVFLDFFPINHRFVNSRFNGRYAARNYTEPFPIDHPLGACLMVRREAINAVGTLDEGFFIYCEEIDWCMRIKEAGRQIYCVPQAVIVHHGQESTRQTWGPMYAELHRSRFRLYRKHYSARFQAMARLIVTLGVAREVIRSWWRRRQGKITPEQYQERARTFRQVLVLALRGG